MDIDAIKELLEGFDLAAFLPDVTSILGWTETLLRICVMAGPILIFGFGLLYLLLPPKEANYSLGYRFWWSMASLDAWQFTHRLVGYIWTPLGFILTIVIGLICNSFRRIDATKMVEISAKCILWELALLVIACVAIDIVVVVVFDSKGFRRKDYAE